MKAASRVFPLEPSQMKDRQTANALKISVKEGKEVSAEKERKEHNDNKKIKFPSRSSPLGGERGFGEERLLRLSLLARGRLPLRKGLLPVLSVERPHLDFIDCRIV